MNVQEQAELCMLAMGTTPLEVARGLARALFVSGDFNPSPILCGLRGALSGVMLRAAVTHGEDWHKGARRPHKGDIVTLEIYLPMQPPHPARPLTPQGPWKDPIRVRMPEACAAVHIAWLRTGKGSLELVIGLLEDKAYLQEQHEGKA